MFKRSKKISDDLSVPSGSCVRASDGSHWYIQKKFKRKIPNRRVLKSWNFPFVLPISDAALEKYIAAPALGFRNGTIVRSLSGDYYLIGENKLRKVTNPDWLKATRVKDIPVVSEAELNLHEKGEDVV